MKTKYGLGLITALITLLLLFLFSAPPALAQDYVQKGANATTGIPALFGDGSDSVSLGNSLVRRSASGSINTFVGTGTGASFGSLYGVGVHSTASSADQPAFRAAPYSLASPVLRSVYYDDNTEDWVRIADWRADGGMVLYGNNPDNAFNYNGPLVVLPPYHPAPGIPGLTTYVREATIQNIYEVVGRVINLQPSGPSTHTLTADFSQFPGDFIRMAQATVVIDQNTGTAGAVNLALVDTIPGTRWKLIWKQGPSGKIYGLNIPSVPNPNPNVVDYSKYNTKIASGSGSGSTVFVNMNANAITILDCMRDETNVYVKIDSTY